MARCPDCNKFVSLDSDAEPEINLDVDDEGRVTGTFEITNACAECGTELRQASFDLDIGPSDIHVDHPVTREVVSLESYLDALKAERAQVEHDDAPEIEIEVENEEGERTSRSEGKGRGVRTFYGAIVRFDVKVTYGNRVATGSAQHDDEVQASAMEEV